MEKDIPPSQSDLSHRLPRQEISRQKAWPFAFLLSFLVLFTLWVVFSDRFDAFHLLMGAAASALVAGMSGDLLFSAGKPEGLFRLWVRLAGYTPLLIYQIFLANLHVMYLVFHPRPDRRVQ